MTLAPSFRYVIALGIVASLSGGLWAQRAGSASGFTARDKPYYLDAGVVNFVRPGLVLNITGADIASDGTIHAKFTVADPKGLPLDLAGVFTPGPITVAFVISYIPKGEAQYRSYTTRVFTNKKTGATVTDPWMDAGGTIAKTADGSYVYTFATRAPGGYDPTVTHTVGGQASRDLTQFGMAKYADNAVFNFVPDGSAVSVVRDVVRTATCNSRCHDPLAVHGNNRLKTELCILCHQPQNQDPYGGSLNFPVMIHRLHRGSDLPSVKKGTPLMINNNDFSGVVFPAGIRNCEVCHDPNSGAAQKDNWFLKPSRAVCGSCHDDVNFDSGTNHVSLPQISDNQCSTCHIPQGELEFDASIKGAHLDPRFSSGLPGVVFDITSIDDGAPGKNPTVAFTIKDKAGNPIAISDMTRIALVLAGPATDYAGMIADTATKAQAYGSGYKWTFSKPIDASATGTYSVAIEGYRNITLLPGTLKAITVRDAGMNVTKYFSVDNSAVQPRRTVVAVENCNSCHLKLEMHGSNRNEPEHCVQCHNVNQTDAAGRPQDKMPAETIAFKTMIHRIHTGANLTTDYTIYGGSGTPTNFNGVLFPGDRRDCAKCHVNGSYQLPLPDNLSNVVNPRGKVNPMGPVAAACMGCHTTTDVASHVVANTNALGESCAVCHGTDAAFSVDKVHAR